MRTELLAPGGSYEGMKMALRAGADAIYMGGPMFGARAYADNPDMTGLLDAIDYCHLHGRKLYLTVNTLLKDAELEGALYDYFKPLYEHGLDAVLVQDTGVFSFIREHFPDQEVHTSTQMSLSCLDGAKLAKKMGAARIVPAREIGLKEIKEIHDNVDIDIECFIHGAMCYSYSGQCLMSSMIGGRSGNRGRCAQPCRMEYNLYKDGNACRSNGSYLMSLKDTNTLEILPDLIENGVYSMKIEGRMKRPEYAAGVTMIYRKYLDLYKKKGRKGYKVDPDDIRMLMDLYNRGGFSQGYYKGWNSTDMMTMERPNHAGTQAVKVEQIGKGNLRVKALEPLHKGDVIEGGTKGGNTNMSFTLKEDAPQGKSFVMNGRAPGIRPGAVLRRTRNEFMLEQIRNACDKELQEEIKGRFVLKAQEEASLCVSCGDIRVSVTGPAPDYAEKRSVTQQDVEKQLRKTGGTQFAFADLDVHVQDGLFFPMQKVNEMRRDALSKLEEALKSSFYRKAEIGYEGQPDKLLAQKQTTINAVVASAQQAQALLASEDVAEITLDSVFMMDNREDAAALTQKIRESGKKCLLLLPPVWRMRTQNTFYSFFKDEVLAAFDGFILGNVEQLSVVEKLNPNGDKIIKADSRLYTYNRRAQIFLKKCGVDFDTVPAELNFSEIRARGAESSELVVYGNEPVMMTANCLVKNTEGCRHTPGLYYMEDRKGARLPVFNHCSICTNIICNSQVLNLMPCADDVMSLKPASLRLDFTIESPQETASVVQKAADTFLRGNKCTFDEGTRGHFRRGVE